MPAGRRGADLARNISRTVGRAIVDSRDEEHAGRVSEEEWRPVQRERDAYGYFDVAPHPGGSQLLVVTAVVVDPQYLELPYIVSTNFKKEADGSGWNPTPCSTTW